MPVKVYLDPSEAAALSQLALAENRNSEQQASWIVRMELRRLGLVHSAETVPAPQQTPSERMVNNEGSGQG